MGFFDRVRNFVSGQGFRDTAPAREAAPAPQPERAPEPQRQEQERGLFERLRDRVTGADRRREQEERQQQERQAQERAEQERQRQETERQAQERAEIERQRAEIERQRQEIEQARAEIERQRQEQERQAQERANFERQERQRIEREVREQLERERQETERREQERQAQEQARQQQERQDRENWRREMGIDRETTGGKGWTIHTVRTPGEVLDQLRAAADAGKRVGLSVHDKNGWHQLYTNTGRGHLDAKSGMTVGGGAGMSASEMLDRFEKHGVPGAESAGSGRAAGGGISPEPGAGLPEMESDIDSGGGDVIEGPEWEHEDGDDYGPDDYYDYIDESDGGDDSDTEGYDPGSVNGYQVVIY